MEFPKALPDYYKDLQLSTGVLESDFATSLKNNEVDIQTEEDFAKGFFSYKQLAKFPANDTAPITNAMKNLLANLFVKASQIRRLMLNLQFKRRQSTRNSRLELLRRRIPHVFQEHSN